MYQGAKFCWESSMMELNQKFNFRHIESDINYALATLLAPGFKNKFFWD
jgi:hypothetical protein